MITKDWYEFRLEFEYDMLNYRRYAISCALAHKDWPNEGMLKIGVNSAIVSTDENDVGRSYNVGTVVATEIKNILTEIGKYQKNYRDVRGTVEIHLPGEGEAERYFSIQFTYWRAASTRLEMSRGVRVELPKRRQPKKSA